MSKISLAGVYSGYSPIVANGYRKFSCYVPMRDGCRLATDYYRPTLGDEYLPRLPTVCIATGYRRSFVLKKGETFKERYFPQFEYGDVVSWVTRGARLIDRHVARWLEPIEGFSEPEFRAWLLKRGSTKEFLMMHGYNVVVVDNRSTGSSFGRCDQLDHQTQGMDLGDLFEWIVRQPWSTEDLGMTGNSWLGLAQNAAISCNPKHLRAVLPITVGVDTFVPMYPNGLYNVGLMRQWYQERFEHESGGYEADVVDEDLDGSLRTAAVRDRLSDDAATDPPWIQTIPSPQEREALLDYYAAWSRDRYEANCRYLGRDLPDGTKGDWKVGHLDPSLANKTSIAYYNIGGYWDLLAYDAPMTFAALTVPRKLLFGPWNHASWIGSEAQETLRWFDFHLKHIDNGIMRELPVTFSTSHPDRLPTWYGADQFPPRGVSAKILHVTRAAAGLPLIGRLEPTPAGDSDAPLEFTVDYDTTVGLPGRQWGYGLALKLNIKELERFRDRVLTIASGPLSEDWEITGYPLLRCHVAINAAAGAIFAYLQDVAPDGTAHYLTDGQLNFRDRKVSESPFDNLGLPYHSARERDRLPVHADEVMDIWLALNPVSWIVPAGHRICLTLTGADLENFHQHRQDPSPRMRVYCEAERPTMLELPVIEAAAPRGATRIDRAFESLPAALQMPADPHAFDQQTLEILRKLVR